MRLTSQSSIAKVLLVLVVVSLASGLAAWAAPSVTTDPIDYGCYKEAKVQPNTDNGCCGNYKVQPDTEGKGGCCNQNNPKVQPDTEGKGGCCENSGKIQPDTDHRNSQCCNEVNKLAVDGIDHHQSQCCSQDEAKIAVTTTTHKGQEQDCPTPPPPAPTGCTIDATGVVGKLFNDQQAYYAPGELATGVIVNAGTYVVGGIATDSAGNKYYRIVVACAYLYVPINTMGPNPDAPQNGEPLPTTPVS